MIFYKEYAIIEGVIYQKIPDEFQEIAHKTYTPVVAKRDTSLGELSEVDRKGYTIKGSVAQ